MTSTSLSLLLSAVSTVLTLVGIVVTVWLSRRSGEGEPKGGLPDITAGDIEDLDDLDQARP